MDDTLPNPLKNFTPRRNPPKEAQIDDKTAQTGLEYVKGLSNEQLETVAIEKLSEALQLLDASKYPDIAVRLANAVLDRTRGKPAQSITQLNVNTTVDENYGIPEAMRIEMFRHMVQRYDEQQALTIEHQSDQ